MRKFFRYFKNYLRRSDSLLLVLCLVASSYGTVLVASAVNYQGSFNTVYVQIGATILGLVMYYIFSVIDVDIIAARWKVLTAVGLLLILSLRWFGVERYGNKAWIRFAGIGIQPAELVKPVFIVTMAHLMVSFSEQQRLNHPVSVLALLAVFGVHFGLIVLVSKDLGSALVYFFIFVAMLFMAGIRWYWLLTGAVAIVAAAPYVWNQLSDYQQQRILAPYFPSIVDPTGQNVLWQTNQSKLALASGRIFGEGLFQGSMTQSNDIPFQQTDFIFSVAGEELGIVGCAAILLLLIAIILRCVKIGLNSQSRLGALVCLGCAAMLAFQTFENIGMCIGVAPVIGLTLPFFSSGGSSLVTTYAAMGIVSGIKMKPKPGMFVKW